MPHSAGRAAPNAPCGCPACANATKIRSPDAETTDENVARGSRRERIAEHDGFGAARARAHEDERALGLLLDEVEVRASGLREIGHRTRRTELLLPSGEALVDR